MNKNLIVLLSIITILGAIMLYKDNHPPIKRTPSENHVIIVGTSADFPPFSYLDANKKPIGFDIDVVNEVAHRIGKKIALHNLEFDALLTELAFGKLDIVAAGMSATPERAKRVFFTQPYLRTPFVVVTLAANPISSLDDIDNKPVIVNEGYTADTFMSTRKHAQLVRLPSISDAFLALNNGQAFAFVTAENTVKSFFSQYGKDKYSIYRIPHHEETNSLVIAKDKPELLALVQQALDSMEKDGTLESLKKKWGLS